MLHCAAQGDAPYSLAFFLKHTGLSINSEDRSQSTPLHWACISRSYTTIRFLLAWKARVDCTDKSGYTPLHLVLRDLEENESVAKQLIKILLSYNASLHARDRFYRVPMDYIKNYTNAKLQIETYQLIDSCTSCKTLISGSHTLCNNDSAFVRLRAKFFSTFISISMVGLMMLQVYHIYP